MQDKQTIKNIRFIAGSGNPNAIMTSDEYVGCLTSTGAVTCFLPPLSVGTDLDQLKWSILDVDSNSATNNITINASGTNKINGASSVTIATNGGSVRIIAVGNNDYLATGSIGSGASVDPTVYTFADSKSALSGDPIQTIDSSFNLIVPAGTYIIDAYAIYFNNSGAASSNCNFGLSYNTNTALTSYDASDTIIYAVGSWGKFVRVPISYTATLCMITEKVTFASTVIIKPLWQDQLSPGTFGVTSRVLRAMKVTP